VVPGCKASAAPGDAGASPDEPHPLNRYVEGRAGEEYPGAVCAPPLWKRDGGWQRSLQLLAALASASRPRGLNWVLAQPFAACAAVPAALDGAGLRRESGPGAVLYGQLLLPGLRALGFWAAGVLAYLASLVLLFQRAPPGQAGLSPGVAAVVFPCLPCECQWGRAGICGPGLHSVLMVSLLGALFVVGHLEREPEFFGEDGGVPGGVKLMACAAHRPGGFYGGGVPWGSSCAGKSRCAGWWPRGSWAFWG